MAIHVPSSQVVFVSAGMRNPKRLDSNLNRHYLYPNYGVIGLASILESKGYDAMVLHGDFAPPSETLSKLQSLLPRGSTNPLFLSIPSAFALEWSREFCSLLKTAWPDVRIVVGGKWVVGTDGAWIKSLLPEVNLVVYGNAEQRIEHLLFPDRWNQLTFTSETIRSVPESPTVELPFLNYSLVTDFRKYQPSVEVSRGCGLGCSFCLEKDVPLQKMQPAENVADYLQRYVEMYDSENITPYFQSSFFAPSQSWSRGFVKAYRHRDLQLNWRSETRVDGLTPESLGILAEGGLKVIDLGLESASLSQISRMEKTAQPERYLERASRLLQECRKSGVWAKVNVLLYAGETRATIRESLDWLEGHKDCIKGVSVNPLFVYRYIESKSYLEELASYGARPCEGTILEEQGYCQMHLSSEIDVDEADVIAQQIRDQFMTPHDHFDLKSFSYLPRGFSYDNYIAAAETT